MKRKASTDTPPRKFNEDSRLQYLGQRHVVDLENLGRVSYGVAHDLNNMLNNTILRLDMALEHTSSPDQERHLQWAKKAALNAAGIVKRLQNFGSLGKDSEVKTIDVNALVAETVEFCRPRAKEMAEIWRREVGLQVIFGQECQVMGNESDLRAAVVNIALNALDAVEQSGGCVNIGTRLEDSFVNIVVRDSGVGIPPDLLSKVFEPFFSTKGSLGTGLGLATARYAVEQFGGRIGIESDLTTGTTVTISLPVC